MATAKTTKAAFPAKTAPVGAKSKAAAAPTKTDKPRRAAVAKAVKAGQDPATAKALAIANEKTPAKPRSAAAKPAAKPAAKQVASKATKPATVLKQAAVPGLPVTEVTSIGQLRTALADFPTSNKFTTDRKFGKDIITVQNMRGRSVAEIHAIPKK